MQPGGLRPRKQTYSKGPSNLRGNYHGNPNTGYRKTRVVGQPQQNRARSQHRTAPGAGKYSNIAGPHSRESNINGDVINYLKDELLATWEAYIIPDYHRTVFLDCIIGLKPQ